MSKIKILSVGECSYLHSGYGRYNNGLLTELHKNPNYQVMEFGLAYNPTYNQANTIPWNFFPNVLPEHRVIDSEKKMEEWKNWSSNPMNSLGAPLFHNVLLETKPDIVIANQDEWNLRYMIDSPYRPYFKLIALFACDSKPQKWEWLDSMSRCDGVLTYSNWGKSVIEEQSPKVKVFSSAPPSCQPSFQILDKDAVRGHFGIDKDAQIIGTVMRNQIRKRFPALFQALRKYIDETGNKKTYLWVHSKYPDSSWSFPELLMEYNVFDRVLFTYTCINQACRNTFCNTYNDMPQCPKCKEVSGHMVGTNTGISSEQLCMVYNCFDVMTLLSDSEGFGLPTVEAASCGIPLMVTDYAALKDVIKTLDAEPIKVESFYKEINTGQDKAVPSVEHLVELWKKFFIKPEAIKRVGRLKVRRNFELNYGWDKTAKTWSALIDSLGTSKPWNSPINVRQPSEPINRPMNNVDYARWLIHDVMCFPQRLNSVYENELVRNLNFQCRANLVSNGIGQPFTREMAYEEARRIGNYRRDLEIMRGQYFNL